jgi:hypothetical protein
MSMSSQAGLTSDPDDTQLDEYASQTQQGYALAAGIFSIVSSAQACTKNQNGLS